MNLCAHVLPEISSILPSMHIEEGSEKSDPPLESGIYLVRA